MAHIIATLFIIVNSLFAGPAAPSKDPATANKKDTQRKQVPTVINGTVPHRGERFVHKGRTYVIVKQLGSGSFANVFEVRALDGNREASALKVFNYSSSAFQSKDPRSIDESAQIRYTLIGGNRLIQELVEMDPIHPLSFPPQIVTLPLNPLRLVSDSEGLALAGGSTQEFGVLMPLGRSVYSILVELQSEKERLNAADQILTQVSQQLIWFGVKNVIHRDVNPHNILLRPNGRFGLADYDTSLESGKDSYRMITPRFAAPEAIGDVSMLRPVSDMYSLGLTLLYVLDPEFRAIRVSFGSPSNFSISRGILVSEIEKSKIRIFDRIKEMRESRSIDSATDERYSVLQSFLEASLIEDPRKRSSAIRDIRGYRDLPEYSGVDTGFGDLDVNLDVAYLRSEILRSQSEVDYIVRLLDSVRLEKMSMNQAAALVKRQIKDPKTKITIAMEANYARTLELLTLASTLRIEIPRAQGSLALVIPHFAPKDPQQFELLRQYLDQQKHFSGALMQALYTKYFYTGLALSEVQGPLWLAIKIGREWPPVLSHREQLLDLLRKGGFKDRFIKYRVASLLLSDANMASEARDALEEMLTSAGLEPQLKPIIESVLSEQKKLSQVVLKFSSAPIKKIKSLWRSALFGSSQPQSRLETLINTEGDILPALQEFFTSSRGATDIDDEVLRSKFSSADFQALTEAFINGTKTQRTNSKIVLANIARLSSNLIPMFVVNAIEAQNPGYQFREIIGLYAFAQPPSGPQFCNILFRARK